MQRLLYKLERNKMTEIIHFSIIKDKEYRYLCNQACLTNSKKITNDYFKVTCKNCKKILNKRRNEK